MAQITATKLASDILTNMHDPSPEYWRWVTENARLLKASTANAAEKDQLWFVHTFAEATNEYLTAFRLLSDGLYLDGWCKLEEAELGFSWLARNALVIELMPGVHVRADLVALWQSIFPYRHFASPGMLYKKWACSICGKQSTPVEPCGHTVGRVYAGELCHRKIIEFEALEVSIVTNPVQKYSVLQLDYDYSVVDFVLAHVSGPFDVWRGEWTHMRHSHENFLDRPHDGPCPCDSGLHYGECCLLTEGVRLPHFSMAGSFRTEAPEIKLIKPRARPEREEGEPLACTVHLLKPSA